jgi:hypothetical protein
MNKEVQLTDAQIEAIAERAAEVALEKVYTEVGKSVVKKVMWFIGAGAIGLFMWVGTNGHIPK